MENRIDKLSLYVLGVGEEPDPRFTLANERTFLAWIRTSISFLAGGVAIKAFELESLQGIASDLVSILLLSTGTVISGAGFFRWVNVERALRKKKPLPFSITIPLVSTVCVATVLVSAVVIFNT